ncbi:Fanconi anemia group D2 protein [Sesamum indicum]|uniref:Fanconi anemia group D2 protein n=1 Tax=Sesamum indicum TaxID=4182 RepID=A0A8M8V5I4_SESIN|nr:Fanconi anemia group D2 protein [Sesamum indicum]
MLSRRRPAKSNNPFVPPFAQPNNLTANGAAAAQCEPASSNVSPEAGEATLSPSPTPLEKMVSVLADAGCTLINAAGPPSLPSNIYNFRQRLDGVLAVDSSLRSQFLKGFSHYISSTSNLRRILLPCDHDGFGSVQRQSLVQLLLLVKSIQQDLLDMLLEKLPEYFDMEPLDGGCGLSSSMPFDEDIARLILNQFRWLDFLVDSEAFAEKLLQILSISPHHLKKEIIGSLAEMIGDHNNKSLFNSLEQMLQEDSSIIVPVLDSFSNLNLDDLLQDQVIMIALSCIRTIEIGHMPYLLRFLLLSAKESNARRIISQIREQLKFFGASQARTSQHNKLKGKSVIDNTEASILDALRSSLRFKNMLCLELLKELKSLEEPRDHKVIDIWLLALVFMSCESLQKSVEKLFKKKILEGCIQDHMFENCIHGIKDLPKDYLPTFLSLSAYLLACKEQRAQEFGIHMYTCLFEEFSDAYSRQEVLGALLTHVGSGICYEVTAALDAMVNLSSKKSQEMISLSSHITGILDYLERFSIESLHKVYEVFIRLAVSAQSSSQPCGFSIANELLMILRKQINNSDLMYKKMGLIGTFKIVSHIADTNNNSLPPLSQRSNYEEAVELLKVSLDSCKQLPLPLILFYEELISTLRSKTLHPSIIEWVSKQVGEFESIYLSDLDNGNLIGQDLSYGLEGKLWMNLDGDISPICLNILPLVSPSSRSSSALQVLPIKFVLLSVVERLTNQGSLGGIDALLGCPIHLPSSKLFSQHSWQFLTVKQKQIAILSLHYAANWMRELLNAFSTQVVEGSDTISQATKGDIIFKLLKRLRNLVFVECLLDNCLKQHPVILPELYPHLEQSRIIELDCMGDLEKMSQHPKAIESILQKKKRKRQKFISPSANTNIEEKLRQPTIVDIWKKAGAIPSQEASRDDLSTVSSRAIQSESAGYHLDNSDVPQTIETSAPAKCLEAQRSKFRPLLVDCLSILACLKNNQGSCCADPSAELPIYLYLLRDLHKKLDHLSPTRKQNLARGSNVPAGFMGMKVNDFLRKLRPLFPYLRKNFDRAVRILSEGAETCQEHWIYQSNLAANPEIINTSISASPALTSTAIFKETLLCFGKMLNLPDLLKEKTILSDLLQAFQPLEMSGCFFQEMRLIPSPGNMDYLYSGAYIFLGGVFDVATNFSFTLASEVLLTLEVMVTSIRVFLNRSPCENGKDTCAGFSKEIIPFLCNKLGAYAQKLLMHKCDKDDVDSSLKIKGEMVQKILRIYLGNCPSTLDSLNELACSVLPQVYSAETSTEDDNYRTFPTLCPATMTVWYRVMHEENISALNNLVKEISLMEKPRGGAKVETVWRLLNKILQSVNVVVFLINMCRNNDKVTIHAMAVKYGGKFIDSFLRVFDFLQIQFSVHKDLILQMIKELQKATRTIQTLCSEAKGSKQTAITRKIPATKRSLERFLFHVKALLYTTPSGCSFWMGNLKHKDLMGQVVSSQAYLDDEDDGIQDDDPADAIVDHQPTNGSTPQ